MILLASILLTVSYPGYMFPDMMHSGKNVNDIPLSSSHSSSRVQEEK
jgi:hypothetical protein